MKTANTIWVVDDDPSNFEVIEVLLSRSGYHLEYFSGGLQVLKQLEQAQPDVLLLDVMMPILDGIEVCRRIKACSHWQSIPIIIVTALTAKEDLGRCLDAGADDFISKPVNGIELRSRIRSMLRIKQQHDHLQSLLQLRSDMVNMLVHDLRNPLASTLMSCELLHLMNLPEQPTKKVDQIRLNSQRLQGMIDSLLTMAKLEAGKLTLDRTQLELEAIASAALKDFQPIAAQKQIEFVCCLPETSQPIWGDANLLRRVVDNLLSNAIKFAPSQSSITLAIDYPSDQRVRLQVSDLGPGISEEQQTIIFDPYEVGHPVKGLSQIGLGLAFCRMAIEAHGGQITVSHNQPRGAVFTVEF